MRLLLIIACVMSIVWFMSSIVAFGSGLIWLLQIFLVSPIAQEPPDAANFGIWLIYTVITSVAPFIILAAFAGYAVVAMTKRSRRAGDGRESASIENASREANKWAMRYPLIAIFALTIIWTLIFLFPLGGGETASGARQVLVDALRAFFTACPLIILALLIYIIVFWIFERAVASHEV